MRSIRPPPATSRFSTRQVRAQLLISAAGACLTTERYAGRAPHRSAVLCVAEPYRAFVEAGRGCSRGLAPVPPCSRTEESRLALSCIPAHARKTGGDRGPRRRDRSAGRNRNGHGDQRWRRNRTHVRIGRHCAIGANVSITNSLIGDRVIVHPGCAIGPGWIRLLDGRRPGHRKVLQIGARHHSGRRRGVGAGTTTTAAASATP